MSYEAWGDGDDGPNWKDDAIENGWWDPDDISQAIKDLWLERERQVAQESFTAEHDDMHLHGELSGAASAYALSAAAGLMSGRDAPIAEPPPFFRFDRGWWKPTTPRRDLLKAAALIIAEIERLDRAAAKP